MTAPPKGRRNRPLPEETPRASNPPSPLPPAPPAPPPPSRQERQPLRAEALALKHRHRGPQPWPGKEWIGVAGILGIGDAGLAERRYEPNLRDVEKRPDQTDFAAARQHRVP